MLKDLLVEMAEDFVEKVVSFSCQIAKNRKSDTLTVRVSQSLSQSPSLSFSTHSLQARDVALHLDRSWNIRIPGYFGTLLSL